MNRCQYRKLSRQITVGSISSGALRSEDLLEAFLGELCRVAPRAHGELKRDARKALRDLERGADDAKDNASDVVSDLQDALIGHAPPFLYFGTYEGDGADYGWWPDMHSIDELEQFDGTGEAAAERFVGEFKVVSDHGNVEIYVRYGNGRIKSLLGIV